MIKNYFSTIYKTMLFIVGTCGFIFLVICFSAFFILEKLDTTFLLICTFSFLAMLGVFVYYFTVLISTPLSLITKILEKNDKSAITKLQRTPLEFSNIGNLFLSNNQQKIELQRSKEKAEESERLKASFLTNLSHEIRTPMNAILGFSDLLASQELTEIEKEEFIEVIRRSGKNLISIIDDLIEMSKIDTQQIKPNYAAINLDQVLNEIKKTVEITIPADKLLSVYFDKPKHPIIHQLISDETKLRQVIVNLVNNAVKYTESGSVNFGYKINSEDHALEFYIKDTGIGISEDEFKSIFNRFNRIQNDKTINLSGLGLGLAISKAYVEMLGGNVWLESTLNRGTTFSFTIPLKLTELAAKPIIEHKINTVDNVKPLTILIAEDDHINYMLIKRIMDLRKYNVIRAKNGEEAVSICKENQNIQLVIMDIKMPKMGGFEARKIIRTFKPYLPIIAHTAYSSAEINSEIYEAGFIDLITKPLDKTKLFRIIDRIEHLTPAAMTVQ